MTKTKAALNYARAKPVPAKHDALAEALAPKDVEFRHISFTFAIIALSARVACAEGTLTRESYIAFRDAFPLSGGLCPKLRKLFVMACNDTTPAEHIVAQVKYAFPRNRELFSALASRLLSIAGASGKIGKKQELLLAKIARSLELSPAEYSALYERAISRKAHHVLGAAKKAGRGELKKRYYALMQRYHPDRHASESLSPELSELLSLRTGEISAAYKTLSRKAA